MAIRSTIAPIDTSDAPFATPPVVVLDLPAPPSVNRTRMVDWKGRAGHRRWVETCDQLVLASRCRTRDPQPRRVPGQYEVLIVMSEAHTGIDLDNGIKALIDYLRKIEIVEDDSPKFFRKLTVEWGSAIEGCRVHVRGIA